MNQYFEVKATYQKLDQKTGKNKKVTETYFIDTVTFGDSEEKIHKVLEESISGEFTVKSISRSNVSEVLAYDSGEYWFKVKMRFEDVDPESGKAKLVNNYLLVPADTSKEAYERCQEHLESMIVPFTLPDIKETKIVDVIPYVAE